jgi:hypothetical protein
MITFSNTGVEADTYEEILEEIIVAYGVAMSLSAEETQALREGVTGTLRNLVRIEAEREAALQEAILAVYDSLSFLCEGAALDRVVRLLGVTRNPAFRSRVSGEASGTNGTVITTGMRLEYNPNGSIWRVVGGPYTISGGVAAIDVEADDALPFEPALDPATGFDDWTILDTLVGWSDVGAFESSAQEIVGSPIETDAALRARASVEAFSRGRGPTAAIRANVSEVDGVTYVAIYDNATDATDANGIPRRSFLLVADGGDPLEIAEAMFAGMPLGATAYGTDETETVSDEAGFLHTISFDRVDDIDVYIRATITTSTSEEEAPADVEQAVEDAILAAVDDLFGIGSDVLPYRIVGAIHAADIPGIDAIVVERSLDGVAWSAAKLSMTIRQRAAFAAARVTVVQD